MNSSNRAWRRLLMTALAVVAPSMAGAELPQFDEQDHLGVATCASSVCHGSVAPKEKSDVLQNEYVTWSRQDRHRVAYQTLLTPWSKQIARGLGLKNAHEAEVCLDCHADNVADEKQGPKFVLADGVGCEACHGGSENYIASHTDVDATHEQNIAAGLYPLSDAGARAELCLSCHLGTPEKMASHDIMGAGHPRLGFELDTFAVLQPAHYRVDTLAADGRHLSMTSWLVGQARAARQTLALIDERLHGNGLFPELSLFDCHACHHSMTEKRWQADGAKLPAGSVRLNDANFVMLGAIARVLTPDLAATLDVRMGQLHRNVAAGSNLAKTLSDLDSLVAQIETQAVAAAYPKQAGPLLAAIVSAGKKGEFRDYVAAEQAVMAVDLLLSAGTRRDANLDWLDALYGVVRDEDGYDPGKLVSTMAAYQR